MRQLYSKWIVDWETRLTTRDNNRVVRPFEWGIEWTRDWPQVNGNYPVDANDPEAHACFLLDVNRKIIATSEDYFGYETPADFHLTKRVYPGERELTEWLEFTSPIQTPIPANNIVRARWYPAKQKPGERKKAVVLLPHWNSKPHSYIALCKILQRLGISTLRLSLPYHDSRLPAETQRSDYAVSSNIARTMDATRQAVIDTRACYDWLEQQGYTSFGIVGTSLGSCYAFLASAHDPRIRVNAFNHASTFFADVVWTGQSTRHIKAGIQDAIDLDTLREAWAGISPANYFDKYRSKDKKVLIIYATYDLTFLPEFSKIVVEKFVEHGLNAEFRVLPCGHYTTGETPFKFMDGWHIGKFLKVNL